MRIRRVRIFNFRGIKAADVVIEPSTVIVGPNGCGKTSVVDAVSLALGRPKMVRPLTEHDFVGSSPDAAARIRILVTLVGFPTEDPDENQSWFQLGRAVPKWIEAGGAEHAGPRAGAELCATVGFAARFDQDSLDVETLRYFHDDDCFLDPFDEEGSLALVPHRLLSEIGYFVLPARRTWDAVASFNSDLFRRTVLSSAGIPAKTILDQRDLLRSPTHPVEDAPELKALTSALNDQLGRLMLRAPKFQLRVTPGDSEGVLQSLLPHYTTPEGSSLPAHRHGTGLVSLQTLLLLLEVGKARKSKKQSFLLALEEPELHLAPGVESRLVAEAIRIADQVVCTTHSPEVARLFEPTRTLVVANNAGALTARPLLAAPLATTAQAWERRFYGQFRGRLVSALMHPFVLVPEGRLDVEWLARLASVGDRQPTQTPPLSCVYGVAPTEDAKVAETVERVARLRNGTIALLDGDVDGDRYAKQLSELATPPDAIFQWPSDWAMEDAVRWILEAGGPQLLVLLQAELGHLSFDSFEGLRDLLRTENDRRKGTTGIKQDLLSHEAIVAAIEGNASACQRAAEVCDALVCIALGTAQWSSRLKLVSDAGRLPHYRFVP